MPSFLILRISFSTLSSGLLVLFVLFFSKMDAQRGIVLERSLNFNRDFVVKSWNSEDGLPNNHVRECMQTKDGSLWIATSNGLAHFDGNSFDIYNKSLVSSLQEAVFDQLIEDKDNSLWLLSTSQNLVRYSNKSFVPVPTPKPVTAIGKNNNEDLLIACMGDVYILKNGKFTHYFSLKDEIIVQLVVASPFRLYAVTKKCIFLYEHKQVSMIYQKKNDYDIFIKNGKDAIYALLGDTRRLVKIDGETINLLADLHDEKFKGCIFSDFFPEDEHNFWLASNIGIYKLTDKNILLINTSSGLSSSIVTQLYKDRENNIWVGTMNEGLNMLKQKTIKTYTQDDGLLANNCGPLLKLNDKTIVISNFCSGFLKLKNGKFNDPITYENQCFYAFFKDEKDDILYAGTYGAGIHCFSGGRLIKSITARDGLISDEVFSIFQDRNKTIWIGTRNGINTYRNGKITSSIPTKGKVSYIMEDTKHKIWFCSEAGLGMIESGHVKMYPLSNGGKEINTRFIYEDAEGIYWIASYGDGLFRLKNNAFFSYDPSGKIMNNFVSCILEDEYQNLWISTNNGIYSAKKSNLNDYADGVFDFIRTRYYGKQDGMKNPECNGGFQNAGAKLGNDKLFFPTQNGLAVVNPRKVLTENDPREFGISSIVLNNEAFQNRDSIKEILNNVKEIGFQFHSPFFGDPHNLIFQYRLDGYDKDWHITSNKREVRYSGLLPGNYMFRLRIYGHLKEKTFIFNISPPFWQNGLFYFLLALSVIVLLLIGSYLNIKRVRRKESEKAQLNKLYAQLELKALQAQINPHFTFNCLNGINYFITANKSEEASLYLNKFSKLLRLFIEHSRSPFISLDEEIELLTLYTELENLRFNEPFDFKIKVKEPINRMKTEVPSMVLQHFVNNAISHGLRHLKHKGELGIQFKLLNDMLEVTITDNGIGRVASRKINREKRHGHISRGTELTQERIRMINIIKYMNISFQIEDLFPGTEKTGTRVIINFPLKTTRDD